MKIENSGGEAIKEINADSCKEGATTTSAKNTSGLQSTGMVRAGRIFPRTPFPRPLFFSSHAAC